MTHTGSTLNTFLRSTLTPFNLATMKFIVSVHIPTLHTLHPLPVANKWLRTPGSITCLINDGIRVAATPARRPLIYNYVQPHMPYYRS
ncbi:hypothetical protein M5D96_002256 [Drosophila gunungcola]|uniref:Uncharacterized protein n=1 Tax=Drosophila gunungcola TaxID=103775 RepID=A0A9Q0BVS7_9MUSC|nr:hypothetical protein M5D96_002256 [Drosophila gunungcola]